MADFLMPTLGADMTAGTLVAWHKKPGDAVRRGEIVADVETDKGTIEVEIFTSGVLEKILVQPGETVPVGTPLATVREEAPAATPSVTATKVSKTVAAAPPAPAFPASVPAAVEAGRLRISPAARELARKLGVDPIGLQGSGRGGAITREDVERAAQPAPSRPLAPPAEDRVARMRKTIAAAMVRSKREIPHYYLHTTIDMSRPLAWTAGQNQHRPLTDRLLYSVLLLKAVALALRKTPELNAVWNGERAQLLPDIHIGMAISLRQGGLVAPALHHTDRQSLDVLMKSMRDLVDRARAGSLRSSELSDPTITVTSLGDQGVEGLFGIINPPQVALVGFGTIVQRPWVVEGQIVPRRVMTATLSGDHRVSDGHRGALFLAEVDRLLQEPESL